MGKIWMKTRFDAGMNMDIPHSINIANAMFGFREMGAEIVPYHLLDDIYLKGWFCFGGGKCEIIRYRGSRF